jgi:hypothetical protein
MEAAMDSEPDPYGKEAIQARDWRLRVSVALTAGWLLLGFIYISTVVGWTDFVSQQAPALGSFLEGAFAPLAFLWLVVGFFLQQQQLRENTRTIQAQLGEMRRTAEQAEVQARAIAADELHSRQDTFLRVNELVSDQLGVTAGWLVTSYTASAEAVRDLWLRHGRGESTAFSLDVIRRCYTDDVDPGEFFYGSEIRRNHTERFIHSFERLLASGERCDPDGMIVDALKDSAHGRLYRLMRENAPEARR